MTAKLTPAHKAQIQSRRNQGERLEALAEAFGVSVGTIHNVVSGKSATKSSRAKPTTSPRQAEAAPPRPSEGAPPSPEDIRRGLAEQVRTLQSELNSAETPAARATVHRLLVSTQQLLSRMTPPDPTVPPPGMVMVPVDTTHGLAHKGEERWGKLIQGTIQQITETWPRCPTCRQPVPPPDFDKEYPR